MADQACKALAWMSHHHAFSITHSSLLLGCSFLNGRSFLSVCSALADRLCAVAIRSARCSFLGMLLLRHIHWHQHDKSNRHLPIFVPLSDTA